MEKELNQGYHPKTNSILGTILYSTNCGKDVPVWDKECQEANQTRGVQWWCSELANPLLSCRELGAKDNWQDQVKQQPGPPGKLSLYSTSSRMCGLMLVPAHPLLSLLASLGAFCTSFYFLESVPYNSFFTSILSPDLFLKISRQGRSLEQTNRGSNRKNSRWQNIREGGNTWGEMLSLSF